MVDYLGNSNKMEVHHVPSQRPNCQLAEILPGHRVWFDTLLLARAAGYDSCHWCIGGSQR